jgi:hypothetical protein
LPILILFVVENEYFYCVIKFKRYKKNNIENAALNTTFKLKII